MTAKIIAVFNQKGGCAKTQDTMQVAGELGLRGNPTLVIDMDIQGTGSIWSSNAPSSKPFPATVISLASAGVNMRNELFKHIKNYKYILIDCPPAIDSQIPWQALLHSHLGIIPVMPDPANIWASNLAIDLARKAIAERELKRADDSQIPPLKVAILPSRVGRGTAYKICMEQITTDGDIKAMKSMLSDRIAYAESQLLYTCITAMAPKSAAANEVRSVVDEILKLLK
ncbi:ParA family protein [Undibacterium oligocarboniphilum]|uniref:ParA family protein n=1 Tax=Undibacterium oligocarboniphilum TaxID=666702 RepID=A0A850QEX3_9BURK|nr:ParA family protein [Undibacterium oligocarboniphilum]MBC3871402.1 ParA family protein [Undibacterium oligocarboniphilum]NVO79022.1 ParA family protein [Undibacterium oligocarboniphilum]